MFKLTLIRFGFLLALLMVNQNIRAQQPWLPRDPSPAASVSQTVGISKITVDYSRPSIRGREVWGQLVPYGWNVQGFGLGNRAPWRAGANENTVLHLSHDATVEGVKVPAGNYGLSFVINKDNSGEVILSKDYKAWGSFFYDSTRDQMRANIMVRDIPNFVEKLEYTFDSVSKNMAELDLNWGKKQFPVKIEFDVVKIVMDNTRELMKGQTSFTWQNFNAAANYSLANKADLDQGLKWADNAIANQPVPSFGPVITKAGILDAMGNHTESEKIMKDAMAKATENEINNYGYFLLGNNQFDKAIAAFKVNTQNHPASPNAWDSLGEAYALAGDKKNAIANFKKSLSMNPPANVKANSEKYLKQLGAM